MKRKLLCKKEIPTVIHCWIDIDTKDYPEVFDDEGNYIVGEDKPLMHFHNIESNINNNLKQDYKKIHIHQIDYNNPGGFTIIEDVTCI